MHSHYFSSAHVRAKNPFDYETCCIFCGEDASEEKFIKMQNKKAVNRRVKVGFLPI